MGWLVDFGFWLWLSAVGYYGQCWWWPATMGSGGGGRLLWAVVVGGCAVYYRLKFLF